MGKNLRRGFRTLSLVFTVFCVLTMLLPLPQDSTANAAGEGVWSAQASGVIRRLWAVYFSNVNNGWAVGESGTLLHTTNGGATWATQNIGVTGNLRSIFFVDTETGWLVGDAGYVAHTSDGGVSWTRQATPASNNLYAVRFSDLNNGLVVGDNGTIFQTSDGGVNWALRTPTTNHNLHSISFADAQRYWVAADSGTFVRSDDGGATWKTQPVAITQASLEKVSFPSPNKGFAVGSNGTIVSTADGGITWTQASFVTTNHLHSVFFTNTNDGWAVGDNGTILGTSDGGIFWNLRSAGLSSRLNDVCFVDGKNGWAVGENGVVLRYSIPITRGPTDTSITQDADEAGVVKLYLNIDSVRDPATGQARQVIQGIGTVNVTLNYDGDGFSISNFKGLSPFDKADTRVQNVRGVATFEVSQATTEPLPPLRFAELYPRITGSSSRTYTLVADYDSISSRGGQDLPQAGPVSLTFRRGDANADGAIYANDPLLIARYLAGKATKDEINLLNAASVYSDGPSGDRVTIKDAMILAQKVAGIRNDELLPSTQFWNDMLAS